MFNVYPVWLPVPDTEEHGPLLMRGCAHQVSVDVFIAKAFRLYWYLDFLSKQKQIKYENVK